MNIINQLNKHIYQHKYVRGTWRVIQPWFYSSKKQLFRLPSLYRDYFKDWNQFMAMGGDAPFEEIAPFLFDKNSQTQSGGGQYFYQDIWALTQLAQFVPQEHHDFGSRFDGFVGQATAISRVVGWDIRPPNIQLPRFEFRQGDLLNLPIPDKSINSLSCLHVAEHIGLGRYGDSIDPDGTIKALKELMRVTSQGGQLLFSMPIGRERVCFNAERIWHPQKPINILNELTLVEFKAVDDGGNFLENVSPSDLENSKYSLGLYRFIRN